MTLVILFLLAGLVAMTFWMGRLSKAAEIDDELKALKRACSPQGLLEYGRENGLLVTRDTIDRVLGQ